MNTAQQKAELIAQPTIYIPPTLHLTTPLEHATAGPTTQPTITLTFNNTRIKLTISHKPQTFSLKKNTDNTYTITKNNKPFITTTHILPNPYHAPNQLFLNLTDQCIYHCTFCPLTLKPQPRLTKHTTTKFITLIHKALHKNHNQLNAIALTSGIHPNNTHIITTMTALIKHIKKNYPRLPIGIEPTILTTNEIHHLYSAGADELKINLQLPTQHLFQQLCPDFTYQQTINHLNHAVSLFGKGKITTNIIYGFGENTQTITTCLKKLTRIGVVPTLRKLRTTPQLKKNIEQTIQQSLPAITSEYILHLAHIHKQTLDKHNLTTKTFQTMCHPCRCCDLVPFYDI